MAGQSSIRVLVVVVVCALGLTGITLVILNDPVNPDYAWGISSLAILAVASILVLRVPENRVSWLMLAIALGFVFMVWAEGITHPEVSEIINGIGLFGLVLPGLGVFLPLWFPSGRPPTTRWRWVGWITGIGVVTLLAGLAVVGWVEQGDTTQIGACTSVGTCSSIGGLVAITFMVPVAIVSFITRWKRSRGVERQQLRWLVPVLVVLGIGVGAEFGGFQGSWVAEVFLSAGVILVPVAIALAILRYRLYDIDRIISRTVSYTLVAGFLGLLVAGVAAIAGSQFDRPLVVAATTLAVAALFNPVRRRVQRSVDRRFNRSRYDAQQVMDGFIDSLRNKVDGDGVIDGWVGVVGETMEPAALGVWVRDRSDRVELRTH